MIHSMTAFARVERRGDWGQLTWELRSVNHRYLELVPRLPEMLRSIEPQLRERCARRLGRGKVELNLRYRSGQGVQGELSCDRELVGQLLQVSQSVADLVEGSRSLGVIDLLRWPGVVVEAEPDLDPIRQVALTALDEALDDLLATRSREGARTAEFVAVRCRSMGELVELARQRRPLLMARLREKLETRLAELATIGGDPGRLEQEMVIVAQKLDVDEELDRLGAHLEEVAAVLDRTEPVGRRLDFLMQELNREANTLASKSSDAESTRIAVDLKVLIEQTREQVQNVE